MDAAHSSAFASYLGWLADAGVAEHVQDDPAAWLQRQDAGLPLDQAKNAVELSVKGGKNREALPEAHAAPPIRRPLPATLADFDRWLLSAEDVPGASWSSGRVGPVGDVNAALMVISDMPDPEDFADRQLLSGEVGQLFDAMIGAIGRRRPDLRLASIAVTRPPGGRWDDGTATALREIMLHHIQLVQPARIILLGQMTCRLLTGQDVDASGHDLRNINHYGVTTAVTAIHHPRLLLRRANLKRGAWTALKMLREPT